MTPALRTLFALVFALTVGAASVVCACPHGAQSVTGYTESGPHHASAHQMPGQDSPPQDGHAENDEACAHCLQTVASAADDLVASPAVGATSAAPAPAAIASTSGPLRHSGYSRRPRPPPDTASQRSPVTLHDRLII